MLPGGGEVWQGERLVRYRAQGTALQDAGTASARAWEWEPLGLFRNHVESSTSGVSKSEVSRARGLVRLRCRGAGCCPVGRPGGDFSPQSEEGTSAHSGKSWRGIMLTASTPVRR